MVWTILIANLSELQDEEPEHAPTPQPEYRPSGLPACAQRLPKRFRDDLPPLPQPPVVHEEPATPDHDDPMPDQQDIQQEMHLLATP